ncbi:phage holin family protein [Tardiphaga sp. vice154]|uniref:phage holin family protein n=1 Tax=Tardiphaga sp. vice154 TaxID=2592814 RepID=UPI00116236BC|nr:phage holin family protein [Tardiphaga sp. vice154]QDM23312.1 phage holin family protein [Tardiphaga sp. vice154]
MHPLAIALLRTGLALKISQVKRATESYARDRVEQTQGTAVSYAVAGGLYAAAGIFAIALLLVGATALFRWIEISYGLFQAFGATAAILLVLAIICAALAASRLKQPAKRFPSLGSRLRVAISATPGKQPPTPIAQARNTAAEVLSQPASPHAAPFGSNSTRKPRPTSPSLTLPTQAKAGLVLAAALAAWAMARRRSIRPRRPAGKASV